MSFFGAYNDGFACGFDGQSRTHAMTTMGLTGAERRAFWVGYLDGRAAWDAVIAAGIEVVE